MANNIGISLIKLANNISRAVGKISNRDGKQGTKKANKIVKFKIFYNEAKQNFYKVEC